jgi:hypothetical protein
VWRIGSKISAATLTLCIPTEIQSDVVLPRAVADVARVADAVIAYSQPGLEVVASRSADQPDRVYDRGQDIASLAKLIARGRRVDSIDHLL